MADLVRRECDLLFNLLDANRRPSVYRHHRFFRETRHAAQLARKCYAATGRVKAGHRRHAGRDRLAAAALLSTHRALVRAVEACTAELAANRIDTVALCIGFTALLSRLGCCVGQTLILRGGSATLANSTTASYLRYLASREGALARVTETPSPPSAVPRKAAATTYGDTVNRIQEQTARKRR